MQARHILMMVAIFAIGYVFARYYPQIGNKVGLP